ncbi:unnamed protein product [Zymoseptoria tritici ST99CH_3D1]|nr:unnamed protein product [Zymoseptoria tritici ST99CH_3D1]
MLDVRGSLPGQVNTGTISPYRRIDRSNDTIGTSDLAADEQVLLGPFNHLDARPGKEIRSQLIDAFDSWLQVPTASLAVIKNVVRMLHNASLLIDDIQDNSELRRGAPAAHHAFGTAQTINSANYVYFRALRELSTLHNPVMVQIYTAELLNLHHGQGMDLFWRETGTCPTESRYLEMVGNKTGGLFRLAIRCMCVEGSPKQSSADYIRLATMIGILFQILDDFRNLTDGSYTSSKGFCEDLTEGKFSFPIVHAIRSNPGDSFLHDILRQHTDDPAVKKEAVSYLERCGSLIYTQGVIRQLAGDVLTLADGVDAGQGRAQALKDIVQRLMDHGHAKDEAWTSNSAAAAASNFAYPTPASSTPDHTNQNDAFSLRNATPQDQIIAGMERKAGETDDTSVNINEGTQAFSEPLPFHFDLGRYAIPHKLYIHGDWSDSSKQQTRSLTSAVTDQVICDNVHWATGEDVDRAVDSAERGLKAWQALSKRQRREALVKYGELLREHAQAIFWLEAVLTGKARSFSAYEVDAAAETFKYYASSIDTFHGQVISQEDECIKYTLHQPFGICAAVLPFNGPLVCFAMKAAPALAAGNALIVKASELNPFSTMLAISLSVEAGIPPGTINGLIGDGEAGNALASHMKIRKISFTGSLPTARLIQTAAAQSNLKSVTLELGGKSPIIVFPDADLDRAAEGCCQFLMLNGQGCMLGTRVYLHKTISDQVISRIQATVQMYEANLQSDPFRDDTWSSPLFNARQRETVLRYIEHGKSEATLLPGGGEVIDGSGCYIRPAIFTNPSSAASILKSEIFGPVVVISTFEEEDVVIKAANDSELGLGAFVWTRDIGRALRVSSQIEAGCVGVNGNPYVPWVANTTAGGWKQSGQGVENGFAALLDWTQTKSVKISG